MNEKTIIKIESELEVLPEEIEIVSMISNGVRPKEIAEKLGIRTRQAEYKIFTLRKKYKVNSPAGLAILFYRNNLIQ